MHFCKHLKLILVSTTRLSVSTVAVFFGIMLLASVTYADHYHGGWMSASIDENGLVTVTCQTKWDNEQLDPYHGDEYTTGIVRPDVLPDVDWIRFEILDAYRGVLFSSWVGSPFYDSRLEIDIEGTTVSEDLSDPLEMVRTQEFTLDFADFGLPYGEYIIYWTDAGWAYVNNQDPYPESPPWSLECKIIWDGTPRNTPFIYDDFDVVVTKAQDYSENLHAMRAPYTGCFIQDNTCEYIGYIIGIPGADGNRLSAAEGFSAINCQLTYAIISLYDWNGDPVDIDVSVWDDDGFGRPGTELARVTIPQESVKLWAYNWGEDNVVDFTPFNLTASPEGMLHVVVDAPTAVPGESGFWLLSDRGSTAAEVCGEGAFNTKASYFSAFQDVWISLAEYYGGIQLGLIIAAEFCCDESPALSYDFITGQVEPRWGPLWNIPEMTVDAYGQVEIPAHITETLQDVNFHLEPGDYRFKAMITDEVTGQYMEFGSLLDVQATPVVIDIKPGSYPNSINCTHDKNTFPVAVLTTPDFDASTIDPSTVYFGAIGEEGAQEVHSNAHLEDVDGDGDIDMLFHFRWGDTNLECHQELGALGSITGQTYDGSYIRGWDAIHTVIPIHADCGLMGTNIHSNNELLLHVGAEGSIGFDTYGAGGHVYYPKGECDMYVYAAGPWIGGKNTAAPDGVISQSTYSSEFEPSEIGTTGERFRVYNSDLAGDKQIWPPEFCDTDGKEIIYGGGQNLVTQYNDLDGYPQPWVFAGGDLDVPLGVEVNQRSLAFTDVKKRNDVIFLWRVTNITDEVLSDMYFGYFIDFDIGEAWDDRTAFFESPDGHMIGIGWDAAFDESDFNFTQTPAIMGFSFLEIPVGATVNYSGCDNTWHTSSELEQYMRLNGTFVPSETDYQGDMRFVMAAGPFTLGPGEHEFVSATIFLGDVPDGTTELATDPITFRPDPYDPVLADLLLRRPQVQDYYDANLAGEGLVKPQNALPQRFSLIGNHPNPFNPSTTISYALADGAHTKLDIYNVLGQNVRTLVNTYQSAGEYDIHWDGSDKNGQPVASGVYFYRLKSGDNVDSKKMVMMK